MDIDTLTSKAKVEIMGREYTLKGDIDQEYMIYLAKFVDQKIQSLQKGLSTSVQETDMTKLVLLASLNLADELFITKKESEDQVLNKKLIDVENKTNHLIELLEEGLVGEHIR